MYVKTAFGSANSTARLTSSSQDATDNQGLCLSFFYHMYGYNINTLSVFLSTGGNEEVIFRRSQNQGNRWWRATAQIRSSSTWRIIFEGRRGTDYRGDIAIDDISIVAGPCPTEGKNVLMCCLLLCGIDIFKKRCRLKLGPHFNTYIDVER
ncbi:MAM and LDL-receptor class A domain-containing protein 2 [Holothuria leucospilota]|uniref:MAM and LDL-receptor class A domain-containing protein 2 n=1 Tax=Holothuria leucospilota TaxID=206669 RepID=A0A9Q0YMF8_HOLLE|nr:MAM and LDL-receptor class A domain-containing protein 2 [Holothuria leucospilota]